MQKDILHEVLEEMAFRYFGWESGEGDAALCCGSGNRGKGVNNP